MAYKPFPIYDLKKGKVTARAPWLIPKDAFEILHDCYMKFGVLEKRRGYSKFGQVVHTDTTTEAPTLSTNPVMGIKNYYNGDTETLLVMDQDRINTFEDNISTGKTITAFADLGGGEVKVTAVSHGFVTGDIVTQSGTTNYNGTFYATKVDDDNYKITAAWVADDATGQVDQEQFVDLTRNKIRYKGKSGQNWTPSATDVVKGATSNATGTVKSLILDTGAVADEDAAGTIVFENGTVSGTFQSGEELQENGTPANIAGQADGANTDDEFTGDNTNFFQIANWNDIGYITNDVNVIQKYNGTDLSRFHIDLDVEGGPDNDVDRCKLIFIVRGRICIFDTTERGVRYRQRGRWCQVDAPTVWRDDDYWDCPTEGIITGAGWLGNDLYIFFSNGVEGGEVWMWEYTSDEDLPFAWVRVDKVEGAYATNSIVELRNQLIAISQANIIGMDGRSAYKVDAAIPDFVLSWIQNSIQYSQSFVLRDESQVMVTYTSAEATAHADGNTYPDSVVYLNFDDWNWATGQIPIHCFGRSRLESGLAFEDIEEAFKDIDWTPDSKDIQAGYPTPLFGSQDGKIYRLNYSLSDDGAAIDFEAFSAELNPFVLEGRQARLGNMDFLVDIDDNSDFVVHSYLGNDSTAFKTTTITCSATGPAKEMTWHRISVNASANCHRFKLTNDDTGNRPRIHAIVLWFEPAGLIV